MTFVLTRPEPLGVVPVVAVVDPPTSMGDVDAGEALAALDAGAPPEEDAGVALVLGIDLDAGTDEAEVKPIKTRVLPPPTARQLKERIARLTARARKKKNLDPSALQLMGRYRLEAASADSPVRRAKLEKALTDWERNFLKK